MRLAKFSLQCNPSLIIHRSRVTHFVDGSFGFFNQQYLQMAQFLIATNTTVVNSSQKPSTPQANPMDYLQNHEVLVLVKLCDCYWLMVLNMHYHCGPCRPYFACI